VQKLQSISAVIPGNNLVAVYHIHGRKEEVLFFCSIPDTTQDLIDLKIAYLRRVLA
jgi:hypothetical protein